MGTIDVDVYRQARRAGHSPVISAYVARPPVLALVFDDDGSAEFTHDGHAFRATLHPEEDWCGCEEQVTAWREGDESLAWMTDGEYERTYHQWLTVELLDDAGIVVGQGWTLGGVCVSWATMLDVRFGERYVAEIAREGAEELAHNERTRLATESALLWVAS